MKRKSLLPFLLLTLGIILIGSALQAGATETRTGFLIPSQCKPSGPQEAKGATDAWPAPHTTECALREACIKSGYGIWADDQFYLFDKQGQDMALHYFKTTTRTSYHKVLVVGDFNQDEVQVKFIRQVD